MSLKGIIPHLMVGPLLGDAISPGTFDGDLRDLPLARPYQPGDPIKEIPQAVSESVAETEGADAPSVAAGTAEVEEVVADQFVEHPIEDEDFSHTIPPLTVNPEDNEKAAAAKSEYNDQLKFVQNARLGEYSLRGPEGIGGHYKVYLDDLGRKVVEHSSGAGSSTRYVLDQQGNLEAEKRSSSTGSIAQTVETTSYNPREDGSLLRDRHTKTYHANAGVTESHSHLLAQPDGSTWEWTPEAGWQFDAAKIPDVDDPPPPDDDFSKEIPALTVKPEDNEKAAAAKTEYNDHLEFVQNAKLGQYSDDLGHYNVYLDDEGRKVVEFSPNTPGGGSSTRYVLDQQGNLSVKTKSFDETTGARRIDTTSYELGEDGALVRERRTTTKKDGNTHSKLVSKLIVNADGSTRELTPEHGWVEDPPAEIEPPPPVDPFKDIPPLEKQRSDNWLAGSLKNNYNQLLGFAQNLELGQYEKGGLKYNVFIDDQGRKVAEIQPSFGFFNQTTRITLDESGNIDVTSPGSFGMQQRNLSFRRGDNGSLAYAENFGGQTLHALVQGNGSVWVRFNDRWHYFPPRQIMLDPHILSAEGVEEAEEADHVA